MPVFADIRTGDARALVRDVQGRLGPGQTAALLRCYGIPLADLPPAGTEVTVTVADDRMFGSLVTLDSVTMSRTARFTPLTDVDAAQLMGSHPLADPGALQDLLLRVSRLAEDLPEVTDLRAQPGGGGPGRGGRGERAGHGDPVPAAVPVPAQIALRCRPVANTYLGS